MFGHIWEGQDNHFLKFLLSFSEGASLLLILPSSPRNSLTQSAMSNQTSKGTIIQWYPTTHHSRNLVSVTNFLILQCHGIPCLVNFKHAIFFYSILCRGCRNSMIVVVMIYLTVAQEASNEESERTNRLQTVASNDLGEWDFLSHFLRLLLSIWAVNATDKNCTLSGEKYWDKNLKTS